MLNTVDNCIDGCHTYKPVNTLALSKQVCWK